MVNTINKRMHKGLDRFLGNIEDTTITNSFNQVEPVNQTNEKKRVIKKNSDGLIERIDNKIYIAEDNRQLLND